VDHVLERNSRQEKVTNEVHPSRYTRI
jgi:hypothetical protein